VPDDGVAQCDMTLQCCVGRCIAFVSLEITQVFAAVPHNIYFVIPRFFQGLFYIVNNF
jgi:hypothetical protein